MQGKYRNLLLLTTLFLILVTIFGTELKKAQNKPARVVYVTAPATPIATLTQREQIINYVIERFGKDAPNALKLLTVGTAGKGNVCLHGENKYLNPDAVYTDTSGQKDYGVFQICATCNGIAPKYLLDFRTNIDIAYNIFKSNGDFHTWTCGKVLGI